MAEVKQNENNFEVFEDGKKAGLLNFQKKDDHTIEIIHTEVDEAYGGKGLGKELVKAAVAYAKENNYKIIPSCSYAKKVINETHEFQEVLK